ncbi:MAG: PTS sugar transporter subunit IIA [Planctomycetota bacterium]
MALQSRPGSRVGRAPHAHPRRREIAGPGSGDRTIHRRRGLARDGSDGGRVDRPGSSGCNQASVLRELVNLAERTGLLYEGPALHQALREREALGSTALPHGLAIPHPEKPMPYTTAEPLVCLARVPNPVAFNAPDGALTQLFFLICSHESNAHLHVLARLMRMLDDGMIDTLRAIEDPAEALQVMIAREQQVAKTVS